VGLERGPLSLVRTTEELGRKPRLTTGGIRCADHAIPSIRASWHYFANKRRSLGRHSSLADQSHGVLFINRIYWKALMRQEIFLYVDFTPTLPCSDASSANLTILPQ
jgi:hypothetical protein